MYLSLPTVVVQFVFREVYHKAITKIECNKLICKFSKVVYCNNEPKEL